MGIGSNRFEHFISFILIIPGAIVCLAVFGWQEVASFLVQVANDARSRSHILDDLLFGCLIAIVAILALPGTSMLELICGFVLGFTEGFIVSLVAIIVSSMIAFLLGRYFLREHISNYLNQTSASDGDNPSTFKMFLKSIEQRNGIVLLILFRLMFIPMFVKNYGPSVINTSIWHYAIAVLITSPPYVAIFSFIGSHAESIADIAAGGSSNNSSDEHLVWTQIIPIIVSVLAAIIFTTLAYLEFRQLQASTANAADPSLQEPLAAEEAVPIIQQSTDNSPT